MQLKTLTPIATNLKRFVIHYSQKGIVNLTITGDASYEMSNNGGTQQIPIVINYDLNDFPDKVLLGTITNFCQEHLNSNVGIQM